LIKPPSPRPPVQREPDLPRDINEDEALIAKLLQEEMDMEEAKRIQE
jgi:hypothetical protein